MKKRDSHINTQLLQLLLNHLTTITPVSVDFNVRDLDGNLPAD
jgi:hypothetical protein